MIFVDVGAHEGQTLEEVVKPRYGFDRIYALEPMPDQFAELVLRFGGHPGVTLLNAGLADQSGRLTLYGDNEAMDATLYATKRDTVDPTFTTECAFLRASDFVGSLPPGLVVVKLNCEGGEIPILDDLVSSGAIWGLHEVMIDFDIRKVDGHEAEEQRILGRLASIGFSRYSLSEEVMQGETHQERIAGWLDGVEGRTW